MLAGLFVGLLVDLFAGLVVGSFVSMLAGPFVGLFADLLASHLLTCLPAVHFTLFFINVIYLHFILIGV